MEAMMLKRKRRRLTRKTTTEYGVYNELEEEQDDEGEDVG